MKLTGLIPLFRSMKKQGLDCTTFRYKVNQAEFDVFFTASPAEYSLLFGHIGSTNFSFIIPVKPGFNIDLMITPKEKYIKLCEILRIHSDSFNPLKTSDFFKEFNEKIPELPKNPTVSSKLKHLRNAKPVEECDKIHFYGWIRHPSGPRQSNLEKTLAAFGYEEYCFCKKYGVSSQWTAFKEGEKPHKAARLIYESKIDS